MTACPVFRGKQPVLILLQENRSPCISHFTQSEFLPTGNNIRTEPLPGHFPRTPIWAVSCKNISGISTPRKLKRKKGEWGGVKEGKGERKRGIRKGVEKRKEDEKKRKRKRG